MRFYLRGTYGPFHRKSSAEGFEPSPRLKSLEDVALASCRGRVLNAGAGAGRHSLLLRDAGLEVVSIDVDPTLVQLMKRRGLPQVYQADIFSMDLGVFETILFLQFTIGLAGTLERLQQLLALLRSRLGLRGQILLDQTSPRVVSSPLKYAGEETFQVDLGVLSACARAAGYDAELLARGSVAGDYLARLTPR